LKQLVLYKNPLISRVYSQLEYLCIFPNQEHHSAINFYTETFTLSLSHILNISSPYLAYMVPAKRYKFITY